MLADEVCFCPRCGKALQTRFWAGQERPACPACDWIYFPDPRVAAAVLVEQAQGVLLAQRVNTPQRGLWTLPAGFVDAGEDPAQAAVRECLEETGLVVQITALITVLAMQEHPRGAHILIVYTGEVIGGTLAAGDDAAAVAFFKRDQLPPLAFESTNQILNIC